MGYEIKIYVGEIHPMKNNESWFITIGTIDLHKISGCLEIYNLSNSKGENDDIKNVAFYHESLRITKDNYGKEFVGIPIEKVIGALKHDVFTKYRRFIIALDFLQSIKNQWGEEQLYCILFGY